MIFSRGSAPRHSLCLGLLSTLMLLGACSKPVTCALEGCSSNESVSLATDANSADAVAKSQSAMDKIREMEAEGRAMDAREKAEKDAHDKKIAEIFSRLSLSEALARLHSETLVMHNQRLLLLEAKSAELKSAMTEVQGRLDAHDREIAKNEASIAQLDIDLRAQLASLAAADQAQIEQFNAALGSLNDSLLLKINELSQDMALKISGLVHEICELRKQVIAGDEAVAAAASLRMDEIKAELDAAVLTLNAADAANLQQTLGEIAAVDSQLKAVVVLGVNYAIQVQNQIRDLKQAVKRLDQADKENYKKLNAKIKDLSEDLKKRVAKLKSVDAALADKILALETANGELRADQATLADNFKRFKDTQELLNTQLLQDASQLAQDMGDLRRDINQRIDDEVNRFEDAIADLVSESASSLAQLLSTINGKIADINALMKDIEKAVSKLEKSVDKLEGDVGDVQGDVAAAEQDVKDLYKKLDDMKKDYQKDLSEIVKDIDALEKVVASKSQCKIGSEKEVKNDHNYRSVECDGTKFDVLVRE